MKMGQNKLEKDFRRKLSNREIQPSADAWNRLESMLDQKKKTQPSRKWLYIAAATSAVLLGMTLMFRNHNGIPSTNAVTETAVDTARTFPGDRQRPQPFTPDDQAVASADASSPENRDRQIGFDEKQNQHPVVATHSISGVSSSDQINPSSDPSMPDPAPEASPHLIADAGPVKKQHKISVDPNLLLSEVDAELELSFREKILRSIGKNYQEVKVALANRNSE